MTHSRLFIARRCGFLLGGSSSGVPEVENRRKWCALNASDAHIETLGVRVGALTNKGAHYCREVVRRGRCAIRALTSIARSMNQMICRERRNALITRPGGVRIIASTAHIAEYRVGRTAHENVRGAHRNARIRRRRAGTGDHERYARSSHVVECRELCLR